MIREPIGKWFVWTKKGRYPRYAHDTYESAAEEAKRLAGLHPGSKFIVMHMTDKFHEPEAPAEPTLEATDAQVSA